MYYLEDYNRYIEAKYDVPYSTQAIIREVLVETLGRRDDLRKISDEIYQEIIHS